MTPDSTNITPEELKKLKRKECRRKYNMAHKDDIRAYSREYRKKHKERIQKTSCDYRQTHSDQRKIDKRRYTDTHKAEIKIYNKTYKSNHKEQVKASKRKYRKNNREKIREQQNKNYAVNKEEIQRKRRLQYLKNKENPEFCKKQKEQLQRYYQKNKSNHIKQNIKRDAQRVKTDILYRLIRNCRRRLRYFSKLKENKHTKELIACSPSELHFHLQSKFILGMTWDNYGKVWHIDHIIPLSSAKTHEDIIKLCHYTNLQPLWATTAIAREHGDMFSIGNLEKGDR
jgi:hypothetical protein